MLAIMESDNSLVEEHGTNGEGCDGECQHLMRDEVDERGACTI